MNTIKKVSTNSKVVKDSIRNHILECVYDYNTEETFKTIEESKSYLYSQFNAVAGHEYNLKTYPNEQDRFADYLGGLPFHFEFENYKIEEFLNSLGINPENKEYSNDKMWKLYTYLIFRELKK